MHRAFRRSEPAYRQPASLHSRLLLLPLGRQNDVGSASAGTVQRVALTLAAFDEGAQIGDFAAAQHAIVVVENVNGDALASVSALELTALQIHSGVSGCSFGWTQQFHYTVQFHRTYNVRSCSMRLSCPLPCDFVCCV
jgi:hypothetical protein